MVTICGLSIYVLVSGGCLIGNQIDQVNGASEKFYMVLITLQFGPIWCQKIRINFFSATVLPREVSVLQIFSSRNARYEQQVCCSTGFWWKRGVGVGQIRGWDGMEGDGAIRTRWALILVKCKNYPTIKLPLLFSVSNLCCWFSVAWWKKGKWVGWWLTL